VFLRGAVAGGCPTLFCRSASSEVACFLDREAGSDKCAEGRQTLFSGSSLYSILSFEGTGEKAQRV